MLRFYIFDGEKPAKTFPLKGVYMVGTDHVPVRGEFQVRNGELICHKRSQGPSALVIPWPVKGAGRIMLETTRLLERDRPYNLHVELARGQLMRIHHKREDWGLFDIENIENIVKNCRKAQDILTEAVKASDVAKAAKLADEALSISVPLGEQMSLFHATVFLNRRHQAGQFGRRLFGCTVNLQTRAELYRRRLLNGFDFATVPLSWRQLEPKQGENDWTDLDEWVEWLTQNQIPIKGSPLVSFHEHHIPDWLYIYEHDFEAVRDFIYEHISKVLQRYSGRIQVWDAISSIHAYNAFNFNFEQLMELSRMACSITKQLAPSVVTLVDLAAPWGEYYSRNQRTIPPLLYADMLVQNGINFDAFGLQFYFGLGMDGMFVRDMFQISSMMDRFAGFGKPVHITGAQTPSNTTSDSKDAWGGEFSPKEAGVWYDPWSEALQSRWLREFCNIALSKPFIDTINWRDLSDQQEHFLPHGGLLRPDLSPKLGYEQLCTIRAQIHGDGQPRSSAR